MTKLIIDIITGKILGYEKVNEFTNVYNTDTIVEDELIDGMDISCAYYSEGTIIHESREDYHSELNSKRKEIKELSDSLSNKNEELLGILLSGGSVEEANKAFIEKETKLEALKSELSDMVSDHELAIKKKSVELVRKFEENNCLYNSSVVLLIKDENQYLKEWVDHYISIGFDHIFIYDNGSIYPVSKFISETYSSKPEVMDKITIIDFSEPRKNLQTECNNHFLENYGSQTKWALLADSDEFLRVDNINEFLSDKNDYTIINVGFVEYGANGLEEYEEGNVAERFTKSVDIVNVNYKELFRPRAVTKFSSHFPKYDSSKCLVMDKDTSVIHTDHYYTKSWEEWCGKMARGTCNPNWARKVEEFFDYNPDMTYLKEEAGYVSLIQEYTAG